jgi:membrane associated rhomboid family serine protease
MLASLLVWLMGSPTALQWESLQWQGHAWTLWSSALLHRSAWHLWANLSALGALAVLGWAWRLPLPATLAWLVAWPVGVLGLLAWPQVHQYAGLSGLLHAGLGVAWGWAAFFGVARPLSFVLLAGMTLKLLGEHAWSEPVRFSAEWGFEVVNAAHLGGALAGAASGLVAALAAYLVHQHRR